VLIRDAIDRDALNVRAARLLPDFCQRPVPQIRHGKEGLCHLVAALPQRVGYLVLQVAGLMIAAELAQRGLIQLKQNLAQLLGFRIAGGKTLSVNLTQRADQGVSVFVADFAILVAMAIVESLICSCCSPLCPHRHHPPAGIERQLPRA